MSTWFIETRKKEREA